MITLEEVYGMADCRETEELKDLFGNSYSETTQNNDHVGKSVLDMVEEFRTTAKQKKNAERAGNLVVEEYDEWYQEFDMGSLKLSDELKELSDLVYVCYGYANSMGWNLDEAVRRVHENNMGRMVQDDGTIKYREDGKVMKNPNAPKINLEDLV